MVGNPRHTPAASVFDLLAVIFFPIKYGIAGFVSTLIGAWLYNIVARLAGGIELDLQ